MKREVSDIKAMEATVVVALFCLILHLVFKIPYVDYAGVILIAIALFWRRLSNYIASIWLKFAEGLGKVNSYIILCIVFYVFLTPVALLYRIFNRNPMDIKNSDPSPQSYFYKRDYKYTAADLEKPC